MNYFFIDQAHFLFKLEKLIYCLQLFVFLKQLIPHWFRIFPSIQLYTQYVFSYEMDDVHQHYYKTFDHIFWLFLDTTSYSGTKMRRCKSAYTVVFCDFVITTHIYSCSWFGSPVIAGEIISIIIIILLPEFIL